jgi:hypothetical protein
MVTMNFYADKNGTHIYGNLSIDGTITSSDLNNKLNNISLTPGATGPTGATGSSRNHGRPK